MKTAAKCLLILSVLLLVLSPAQAKEDRTPIRVTYNHSAVETGLIEGDLVETVVTFMPTQDLDELKVNLVGTGVEIIAPEASTNYKELKRMQPLDVKVKLRVLERGGSLTVNYFTTNIYSSTGWSLVVCCYGTKKQ